MNNEVKKMILECIHELAPLSIYEIREVSVQLQQELEKCHCSECIKMLALEMCRLVIEKKVEKKGCMIR